MRLAVILPLSKPDDVPVLWTAADGTQCIEVMPRALAGNAVKCGEEMEAAGTTVGKLFMFKLEGIQ